MIYVWIPQSWGWKAPFRAAHLDRLMPNSGAESRDCLSQDRWLCYRSRYPQISGWSPLQEKITLSQATCPLQVGEGLLSPCRHTHLTPGGGSNQHGAGYWEWPQRQRERVLLWSARWGGGHITSTCTSLVKPSDTARPESMPSYRLSGGKENPWVLIVLPTGTFQLQDQLRTKSCESKESVVYVL